MHRPRLASLMRRSGALAFSLCALALSAPAQTQVLTTDRDTNLLRTVDVASGLTISQKGMLLPGFNILGARGIARRGSSPDVYVLLNINSTGHMLATVDTETGACTAVGNTTDLFVSLAFDTNGVLFAITDDTGALPEAMCILSLSTGLPAFFTTLDNGDDGDCIGWSPTTTRMLHGSGTSTQVFESVLIGNQSVTDIPLSGDNYGSMLDIVHEDGDDFLMAGVNDRLYRITVDGVVSFVADLNHTASGLLPIEDVGTPLCFGDGSTTPCPCGNSSSNGGGCSNSSGLGGRLEVSGKAEISADTMELRATFIPNQPGIFFQGSNFIASPPNFGDGLRCCGMNVVRWITIQPGGGCASTRQPGGCGSQIGGPGGSIASLAGLAAGDTRCYQYWYRDPNGSACGSGFNLTNAMSVSWTP